MRMHTSKEIRVRYDARRQGDMFGFEVEEYLPYMDWEDVKDLLKPDATEEWWNKEIREKYPYTKEAVLS